MKEDLRFFYTEGFSAPFLVELTGISYCDGTYYLSLIHISEPTRLGMISYAVFCLKKKKKNKNNEKKTTNKKLASSKQ